MTALLVSLANDADGWRWFKTSDLGMPNQDDINYLLGRIKDMVKRSGIPITLAELES